MSVVGRWTRSSELTFELPVVYGLLLPVRPSNGAPPCLQDGVYEGGRDTRSASELAAGEFEASSSPYVLDAGGLVPATAWRLIVIGSREGSSGEGVELAWGALTATLAASPIACPTGELARAYDASGDALPCMQASPRDVGEVVIDRVWAPPVCP